MSEPIAYLNGQFLPISEAKLSIFDLGLVQGASVTEMVRTFGHRPFRLDDHLTRLFRSLRCVGFPTELSIDDFHSIAEQVVENNKSLISETDDLGIVIFVTAGQNLTYVGAAGAEQARQATVCVHTFPLPFELWTKKLEEGQHLVTPSIRHIPPDSIDPKVKTRSRLHWYLADKQARLVDPKAGALLLDRNGYLTETSTANFSVVSQGRILMSGGENTLEGVSQRVVRELAESIGIECLSTDLTTYDVLNAEEAFTSSTPYCMLPVTRLNGQPIGEGVPGPVFERLMQAWNDLVGLDIMGQLKTGAAKRQGGS